MRLRTMAAAAALIAAAAASGSAQQQKRAIQAEDLYRLKTASDVNVSPDGRWVAYVVMRTDSAKDRYERELWLAAADGSSRRQLTFTAGAGEGSPAFSPDGRTLAFTARREGDERPQIYLLPLDAGGEAHRLTTLPTGAGGPVWSPDGKRIAFTSSLSPEQLAKEDEGAQKPEPHTPMTRAERLAASAAKGDPHVVTRLDFLAEKGLSPESWTQIYVVDAARGKPMRLTKGDFSHQSPSWTPDGRSIIYSAAPPKGNYAADYEEDGDLYLVASDGSGTAKNLTAGDAVPSGVKRQALPGPGRTVAWSERGAVVSPDGRWIAYSRQLAGGHDFESNSELVVRMLDGSHERCVSCSLDRSARGGTWNAKTGELYFTVSDHGAVSLYRVAPESGEPKPVLTGPRGVLSFDVQGGTLAWAEMNPADISEVYATPAAEAASSPERLTRLNDDFLATVHVQPYEEMEYAAKDGTRIQGWVVRPPDFKPGMPLAVEMHGGPHSMWGPGEQSMWLEYQTLAGDGYVVFFSNPRGSEGYGTKWTTANHGDWGETPMGDVLAGADAVIARGWADKDRQYLTGGSYAGYLTGWMVGHTDRFKAAAAQRGVFDMTTWYGTANTSRLFENDFGTVPWENHELAWKMSPVAYVENIHTPLLLLHGEEDRRVGMGGAEEMYKFLKVLGREVEFVRYPREGHELTRSGEPAHRIDHMNRIVDWFDRHRPDLVGALKAAPQK